MSEAAQWHEDLLAAEAFLTEHRVGLVYTRRRLYQALLATEVGEVREEFWRSGELPEVGPVELIGMSVHSDAARIVRSELAEKGQGDGGASGGGPSEGGHVSR